MYFREPENHTNHVLPYFLVTKPKNGEFPLPTLNRKKTWLLLPDLRLLFKSKQPWPPLRPVLYSVTWWVFSEWRCL